MLLAEALTRYHRTRVEGSRPRGDPASTWRCTAPGYLVLDLVDRRLLHRLARSRLGRGRAPPAADRRRGARIERFLPGLPKVKSHFGLIDPSEDACLAALEAGEQLLVTPGGMREAQPARDFYRLRWEGRYGFVRLALRTGVPIVPFAIVGGAEAYPGLRRGALLLVAAAAPGPARHRARRAHPVARAPDRARDLEVARPIHALARERTQALYDRLLERRGAAAGDRLPDRERLAPLAGEPAGARAARRGLPRAGAR